MQIVTFTDGFVYRAAFVANTYDLDEQDQLNPSNFHYLVSLYTGSVSVIVIHKYILNVQVGDRHYMLHVPQTL